MVTIPHITQNMFYLILAAIAVVGLIVLMVQLIRVRNSTKKVHILSKEAELKKLKLVEIDMESYKTMDGKGLPKNRKEKLNLTKINRSNIMGKIGRFNNEIDYNVNHLESTTEYRKIQNRIMHIDKKKDEIDKKKY
jgi:hypothetical protein